MKKGSLFSLILLALLLISLLSCSSKPTEPELVATPSFNPPGGTYAAVQHVSITCETLLATIYYTLDGSNPNSGSLVYSGPITINETTTIKARSAREGRQDSKIASATYTLTLPPIPENFVLVEGGSFHNGTSDVTVNSFYLDKYELTQADYQAVMGTNPSDFSGNPNNPVECVSWFNAIEYSNRRSLQEGLTPCYSYDSYGSNPDSWPSGWDSDYNNHTSVSCNWSANGYRLPTEAEWQFAARGGNQTHNYTYSGSNTIGSVAWYSGNNDPYGTNPVGTKTANELGLYDMSGNVYEWNWDIYGSYPSGSQNNPTGSNSGSYRVVRGGGWNYGAYYCTVSFRYDFFATSSNYYIGFRVCRFSP